MHVHISVLQALITWLMVMIMGFFWRTLTMKFALSDNDTLVNLSGAMAVIY